MDVGGESDDILGTNHKVFFVSVFLCVYAEFRSVVHCFVASLIPVVCLHAFTRGFSFLGLTMPILVFTKNLALLVEIIFSTTY